MKKIGKYNINKFTNDKKKNIKNWQIQYKQIYKCKNFIGKYICKYVCIYKCQIYRQIKYKQIYKCKKNRQIKYKQIYKWKK